MEHNEGDLIPQGDKVALLQVQLPEDLKVWLKVHSAQTSQTLSEITQQALEQYRAQHEKGGEA